jgi:hypothetical protein
MKRLTIQIEAKAIRDGSNPRLMFSGELWDDMDAQFCVHGCKLRWSCDDCDEYFRKHPTSIPKE